MAERPPGTPGQRHPTHFSKAPGIPRGLSPCVGTARGTREEAAGCGITGHGEASQRTVAGGQDVRVS